MWNENMGNPYFQNYHPNRKNIFVIGLVPGKKYSELIFPILSLNPATNKEAHFLKYPIYVGSNRQGQIYPKESKRNNMVYSTSATGRARKI